MRGWPLWCSVFVAAFAGTLVAADVVRVTSLARDGKVSVSFELADAFTAEVRDAIHSGLPTTFTYDIELRRNVPFWPDRTLASTQIMATVGPVPPAARERSRPNRGTAARPAVPAAPPRTSGPAPA